MGEYEYSKYIVLLEKIWTIFPVATYPESIHISDVIGIDFPAPPFNEVYYGDLIISWVFFSFLSIYCSNWSWGFIVFSSNK